MQATTRNGVLRALSQHCCPSTPSVGIPRVHRAWIPVLYHHHPRGSVWFTVHAEHLYHMRPPCWVHRRWCHWLHEFCKHRLSPCYHIPLGPSIQTRCLPACHIAHVGRLQSVLRPLLDFLHAEEHFSLPRHGSDWGYHRIR